MENSQDLKYFDEPQLTFEDSIISGCHLDLNFAELIDFCTNKKYANLMIFQNLFNLKKIGKYGNSNPHFVDDWINVSKNNKINLNPTIDEGDGSCSFPSKGQISIFYQKIGRVDNPQFTIIKANLEWAQPTTNQPWKFTKPSKDAKQRFQVQVAVQYFEVN